MHILISFKSGLTEPKATFHWSWGRTYMMENCIMILSNPAGQCHGKAAGLAKARIQPTVQGPIAHSRRFPLA